MWVCPLTHSYLTRETNLDKFRQILAQWQHLCLQVPLTDYPVEDLHCESLFSWPNFMSENSNERCENTSKWIETLAQHRCTQPRSSYPYNQLTPNQPHCQVQLLHQKHIKLPIINYLGIFLGVIIPSTYLATLSKNSLVLDTLTTFHIN